MATVTVSRDSADLRHEHIITLTFSGTAVRDADYSVPAATLTLAANTEAVTGRIAAIDDSIDADDVTVVVGARLDDEPIGTPQTITITDDDSRGVVVTPAELTIFEGRTGAYTVALQSEPTAGVTVTPEAEGDVTVTAALTFPAADWGTAQTVTVTAGEDAGGEAATVTHTVAGGDYAATAAVTVTVTVAEPAKPAAPTGLTAEPGEERLTLSWQAPDDNGAAITGYQYRSSTDDGTTWSTWADVADGNDPGSETGDETGIVLDELNNRARVFEVRAVNRKGEGAAARSAAVAALLAAPRDLQPYSHDRLVDLYWSYPREASPATNTGTGRRTTTSLDRHPRQRIQRRERELLRRHRAGQRHPPPVRAAGGERIRHQRAARSVTAVPGDPYGQHEFCLRTPAVQEAVVSSLNNDQDAGNDVSGCAEVTYVHLGSILDLDLSNRGITSLRAGDFRDMSGLRRLSLRGNLLSTLPPKLFRRGSSRNSTSVTTASTPFRTTHSGECQRRPRCGWTATRGSPLSLTVGLKQASNATFRATVPAGAPFGLALPLPVANGSLLDGAATINIRAGRVQSDEFWITRTAGTTGAVTVTIGDLPALPENHEGYALVRSADLPLELIPPTGAPFEPTNLRAQAGNGTATLTWNAPLASAGIDGHEYRYRTTGGYGSWTAIANSAPGQANQATVTVPGLRNGVTHRFQVRAVKDSVPGAPSEPAETFVGAGLGICDRTRQVRDAILTRIDGVSDCAQAAIGHLAAITGTLDMAGRNLEELRAGDLAGLPRVSAVDLRGNQLAALPSRVFGALSSLERLDLRDNRLSTLAGGPLRRPDLPDPASADRQCDDPGRARLPGADR